MSPEVAQALAARAEKGKADEVERLEAEEKQERRELAARLWEAIYAAAYVSVLHGRPWMSPDVIQQSDAFARSVADEWRDGTSLGRGKLRGEP